jgi:hypothetical protein
MKHAQLHEFVQGRRNDANFRFKAVGFNQGDVYNCKFQNTHWEVVRAMKD